VYSVRSPLYSRTIRSIRPYSLTPSSNASKPPPRTTPMLPVESAVRLSWSRLYARTLVPSWLSRKSKSPYSPYCLEGGFPGVARISSRSSRSQRILRFARYAPTKGSPIGTPLGTQCGGGGLRQMAQTALFIMVPKGGGHRSWDVRSAALSRSPCQRTVRGGSGCGAGRSSGR
jgi:hypothetical protein